MKKFIKIIILILLFSLSFIFFLPKENIYYFIEKELYKNEIINSEEQVNKQFIGLEVSNGILSYKQEDIATIKNIFLNSYLVTSQIIFKEISLRGYIKNMIPSSIDTLNLEHSVFTPNIINFNSNGEFGTFSGKVFLDERKITGELIPSDLLKSKYKNLLNNFKYIEGRYLYEFKY